MNSSESLANLSVALARAQAEFKPVGKSGYNQYDKYHYAELEDYMQAVSAALAEHGLALVSSVDDVVELADRTTSGGKIEHAVRVKMSIRIVHTSGEWIETSAWGEGQDRGDKAVYRAVTGARKYGVASALGLVTSDDPEKGETADPEPPKPAPRPAESRKILDAMSQVQVGQADVERYLKHPAAAMSPNEVKALRAWYAAIKADGGLLGEFDEAVFPALPPK